MTLYYKAPTKYYKYVYNSWTQPKLTANGSVGGSSYAARASSTYSGGNPYLAFNGNSSGDANTWEANTQDLNQWVEFYSPVKLRVSSIKFVNRSGQYYRSYTKWRLSVSNDGVNYTVAKDFNLGSNTAGASWTVNFDITGSYKYFKFSAGRDAAWSNSVDSRTSFAEITITAQQQSSVEATSSDYDYSVPNLFKIRDYDTTGIYYGSKPVGFIYQNGKLLYKGRHYEAWSVPSNPTASGYTLQGNPSGNIAALFDKSSSTTRWGQGVSNKTKWFGVIFPFPVIIDAITVKQGFAGSHDDSRTYNVKFRAEKTGADGSGAAVYISNQTSLNWAVDSSTSIPIIAKPICRRVYCDCNMQEYGTLNEVYISGRRVL